jgi:nucleotide-binding universal stress UspA family protein
MLWDEVKPKERYMKTILIPLDGSACAEQVLPYVRRLAPILNARLYLLKVVPDILEDELATSTVAEAYRGGPASTAARSERAWHTWDTQRRHAEGYLGSHSVMLESKGTCVDFEVRLGDPAEEIAAVAEEQHVALIAMATHGYSGVKRWTLGSVTDKVIHSATVPVFVLRNAGQARAEDIAFKRIMVPLDGSELAKQALPFATELAIGAGAELTLIQAVAPTIEAFPGRAARGRPIPQLHEVLMAMRAQASQELAALAGDLGRQEMPVSTLVVNGHAAEVIVDQADQHDMNLIVMATHGYSGIKRWALGSVADKVLHAAMTPLVVVRAHPMHGSQASKR